MRGVLNQNELAYTFGMSSKIGILLLAIVLSLPAGYLLYKNSFNLEPTGTIREVSPSGEVHVWRVAGVEPNASLRFTLSSETSTRMLTLSSTNNAAIEGGWSDIYSDYRITTNIGSENTITDLACDRYEGQIKTARAYVSRRRKLFPFGRLATPHYSGDLRFHCTNPAAEGSIVEGDLHFKGIGQY